MTPQQAASAWSQMTAVTEQRRRQALGLPTPSDLVQRLRDRAYSGLPDPLSEQAAQEIERLRLTAAEREAVERAAQWMVQLAKDRGEIHSAGYFVDDAATLRGLLDRLK